MFIYFLNIVILWKYSERGKMNDRHYQTQPEVVCYG